MSLVTHTPMALETGHRDLPNRVGRGHVCISGPQYAASTQRLAAYTQACVPFPWYPQRITSRLLRGQANDLRALDCS
jgi:hypothetical protein